MSYILDALRRADAERQQGQLPGLHAAPSGAAAAARGEGRLAWGWLVLAALLALAAVVLAVWWWRPAAVPPVRALAAVGAAGPASSVAPVMAPAPAHTPAPAPAPAALPIVVSAAAPAELRPAVAALPAVAAVAAASKPAAATPLPAVPLSALPPDERRQLPPLVPGGSVWSDSAASRFVVLDGMVLREGDAVAPGLVLERIERKAALLRWKDRRIEVPL